MVDFVNIKFKVTDGNGQTTTRTVKVEKGVVIDFKSKEGYYVNSFTINNSGQIVQAYTANGNNKIVKEIEATQEQIDEIMRLSNNDNEAGLTKRDIQIDKDNKFHQQMAKEDRRGKIGGFKHNHPILSKFLPDSVIDWIVNK